MMEAGRELDALVAEKVMGWTRSFVKPENMECPDNANAEWWRTPDGAHYCVKCSEESHPPFYSTEIKSAWTVVEHQRKLFSRWLRFTQALQHGVSVVGPLVAHDFVWRLVEPAHICRAALQATEANVGIPA